MHAEFWYGILLKMIIYKKLKKLGDSITDLWGEKSNRMGNGSNWLKIMFSGWHW